MHYALCIKLCIVHCALCILLCSCRPDGVDGEVAMPFTDMALFEGNSDSRARFLLYPGQDQQPVAIWHPGTASSLNPGDMALITYTNSTNEQYTPGEVNIRYYQPVTNGEVHTEWQDGWQAWDKDPVYLLSAWLTPGRLNLRVKLTYYTEPRVFTVAADPATLGSDSVDLYLVHIIPATINSHDRMYYASFTLAPIMHPGLKAVRLHVANTNLNQKVFTLNL